MARAAPDRPHLRPRTPRPPTSGAGPRSRPSRKTTRMMELYLEGEAPTEDELHAATIPPP